MAGNTIELRAGDICEIFRRYEPDYPEYCKVLSVCGRWLLVERKSDDGDHYGIALFERDSIWRVRFGSKQVLEVFKVTRDFIDIDVRDEDEVSDLLLRLNDRFDCITVYCEKLLPEDCYIGKVESVSGGVLSLTEYRPKDMDETARLDLLLEEITRIEAGGDYEIKLVNHYDSSARHT